MTTGDNGEREITLKRSASSEMTPGVIEGHGARRRAMKEYLKT